VVGDLTGVVVVASLVVGVIIIIFLRVHIALIQVTARQMAARCTAVRAAQETVAVLTPTVRALLLLAFTAVRVATSTTASVIIAL